MSTQANTTIGSIREPLAERACHNGHTGRCKMKALRTPARPCNPGAMDDRPSEGLDARPMPTPAGQPTPEDVLLDVPMLKVDEIELEVANLMARVSLSAEVLNLLRLNVGVDADIGKVRLDIKGVEVQAILKVRLERVEAILARVLDTIDASPEIVANLSAPLGRTLEETGRGARSALADVGRGTGGALQDVGRGTGGALQDVGRGTGGALEDVGRGAGQTLEELPGTTRDVTQDVTGGARDIAGEVSTSTQELAQEVPAAARSTDARLPSRSVRPRRRHRPPSMRPPDPGLSTARARIGPGWRHPTRKTGTTTRTKLRRIPPRTPPAELAGPECAEEPGRVGTAERWRDTRTGTAAAPTSRPARRVPRR